MKFATYAALITMASAKLYDNADCGAEGFQDKCEALTGVRGTVCVKRQNEMFKSVDCKANDIKVVFINNAKETVTLNWHDENGKVNELYALKVGRTKSYNTCAGHVWSASKNGKVSFLMSGEPIWTTYEGADEDFIPITKATEAQISLVRYRCMDGYEAEKNKYEVVSGLPEDEDENDDDYNSYDKYKDNNNEKDDENQDEQDEENGWDNQFRVSGPEEVEITTNWNDGYYEGKVNLEGFDENDGDIYWEYRKT